MTSPYWALAITLLLWWGSTGVVLYLATRRELGRPAMVAVSVVALVAAAGVLASRDLPTAAGAWCAFSCGLLIWGWIEMSYLTGLLTGPRRARVPCAPGLSEGRRFLGGIATSLWHELAIVAVGGWLLLVTADSANRVAAWTFAILWVMRWSAKLNLFLGVPNLNAEFFPEHLRYLETWIRRRSMNLLFPVSVTAGTLVAALFFHRAAAGTGFDMVAGGCLGTLLALAVLEHWFLVVPLPDARLWRWALPGDRRGAARSSSAGSVPPPAALAADAHP